MPLYTNLHIWVPFHLCSKSILRKNKFVLVILIDFVVRAGISSDWFLFVYSFDILQFSNFPEGQRAYSRWWVSLVWSNTSSTLLFKKLTIPTRVLWKTRRICHHFLWQVAWLILYPHRPSRKPKGQGSRRKIKDSWLILINTQMSNSLKPKITLFPNSMVVAIKGSFPTNFHLWGSFPTNCHLCRLPGTS